MITTGLVLVCLSGILSVLTHEKLILLYVWAAVMGVGIGLVVPVAFALISEYFTGNEKSGLMGLQTSAANLGSMFMTFFGGLFAAVSWYWNYLVYLVAVPGLVLTFLYLPDQGKVRKKKEGSVRIPMYVPGYGGVIMTFMLVFYIGPTNLAMFAQQRRIGDAATAGMAATCLLLGGTLMGLLFGKVSEKLGNYMIPLGFWIQTAGFLLLYLSDSRSGFYVASFVAGMGVSSTLPQCMICLAQSKDTRLNAFASSFGLACGNLGTFMAPLLTNLSKAVTGQDTAQSRFLFSSVAALLVGLILAVFCRRLKHTAG